MCVCALVLLPSHKHEVTRTFWLIRKELVLASSLFFLVLLEEVSATFCHGDGLFTCYHMTHVGSSGHIMAGHIWC